MISYSRPHIFDVLTFHVIALLGPTWNIESYLKCHYKLARSLNYMVHLMEEKSFPFEEQGIGLCSVAQFFNPPGLAGL